jgi:TIR domain
MFMDEFVSDSSIDNGRLLVNCIRWLSYKSGPVPSRQVSTRSDSPVRVFYSYSHKDEKLRHELEQHLALLKRQGLVADWHDRRIVAGQNWEDEISEGLESAQVILLLVSASFLSSDYCYGKEMGRAIEQRKRGKSSLIPIIIRPVDWQSAPFADFQVLPTDGKAVTTWTNRDEAWTDVALGIRRAVEAMRGTA